MEEKENVRDVEGKGEGWGCLTSLASLLVLRLCCMARDSAMSVTGLWIFFRSRLYFTCTAANADTHTHIHTEV